jgi:enterochelin esterase-like enzyme
LTNCGRGTEAARNASLCGLSHRPASFSHLLCHGNEDAALGNVSRMSQSLRQLGIRHHLNISGSGHTFFNWRRYLAEFLKGL